MTNNHQKFNYLFANHSFHIINMNKYSLNDLKVLRKEFHPTYFRSDGNYFTILNFNLSITHPAHHILQRLSKISNSGYSLVVYYNKNTEYWTIRLQLLLWNKSLKTLCYRVTKLEKNVAKQNPYSFALIFIDELKMSLHDFLTSNDSSINQYALKTDLLNL